MLLLKAFSIFLILNIIQTTLSLPFDANNESQLSYDELSYQNPIDANNIDAAEILPEDFTDFHGLIGDALGLYKNDAKTDKYLDDQYDVTDDNSPNYIRQTYKNPINNNNVLLNLKEYELSDDVQEYHKNVAIENNNDVVTKLQGQVSTDFSPVIKDIFSSKTALDTTKKLTELVDALSNSQISDLNPTDHILYATENHVNLNKSLPKLTTEVAKNEFTLIKNSCDNSPFYGNLLEANKKLREIVLKLSKHEGADIEAKLDKILFYQNPFEVNIKLTELLASLSSHQLNDFRPTTDEESFSHTNLVGANKKLLSLAQILSQHQPEDVKHRLDYVKSHKDPTKLNKELIDLVTELYTHQVNDLEPSFDDSQHPTNLDEVNKELVNIVVEFSKHQSVDLSLKVQEILSCKNPDEKTHKLLEFLAELSKHYLTDATPTTDDSVHDKNQFEDNEQLVILVRELLNYQPQLADRTPNLNHILSNNNSSELKSKLLEFLAGLSKDQLNNIGQVTTNVADANQNLIKLIQVLSKHQTTDVTPKLEHVLSYKDDLEINKHLLELLSELCRRQLSDVGKTLFHKYLTKTNQKFVELIEKLAKQRSLDLKSRIHDILSYKQPDEINNKLMELLEELSQNQLADEKPTTDFERNELSLLNQNLLAALYDMLTYLPNHKATYTNTISNILTEKDPKVVKGRLLEVKTDLIVLLENDRHLVSLVRELLEFQPTTLKSTFDYILSNTENLFEVKRNLIQLLAILPSHQLNDVKPIHHDTLSLQNITKANESLLALIRELSKLQNDDVESKIDVILSQTDYFESNEKLLQLLSELSKHHLTEIKPTSNESLSLKKLVEANDRLRGLVQELSEHQTTDALTRMENIFSHNDPFDINVKLVELVAELSKHQGTVTKPTTDDSSSSIQLLESNTHLIDLIKRMPKPLVSDVEHRLDYITLDVDPVETNRELLKLLEELTDARPATDESITYENVNNTNRKLVTTVAEFLTHEFLDLKSRVNNILSNKNPDEVNKRLTELVEELIHNKEYDAEPSAYNLDDVPTLVESNQQLIRLVRQSPKHQTSEIKTRLESILSQENPFEINKELTALVSELYINQITHEPLYIENLAETNQMLVEIIKLISKQQNIDLTPRVDYILNLKTPVDINKKLIELVAEVYNQQFDDDTISKKYLEESKQILLRLIQQISKQRLINVNPRLNSILTSSENPAEISKKFIDVLAEFADDSYYYNYLIESNTKLAEGIIELSKYQFIDRKPILDEILAYENRVDTNKLLVDLVAQVATEIKNNPVRNKDLEEANNKLTQLAKEFSTHQRINIHPRVNGILSSENPIEINMKLSQLVAELSENQLNFDSFTNKNLQDSIKNLAYVAEEFSKLQEVDFKPEIDVILSGENSSEVTKRLSALLIDIFSNKLNPDAGSNTSLEKSNTNLIYLVKAFSQYRKTDNYPRLDDILSHKSPAEINDILTNMVTGLFGDALSTISLFQKRLQESNEKLKEVVTEYLKHDPTNLKLKVDEILSLRNLGDVNTNLTNLVAEFSVHQLNDSVRTYNNLKETNEQLVQVVMEFSNYTLIDPKPRVDDILACKDNVEINQKLTKLIAELTESQFSSFYKKLEETNTKLVKVIERSEYYSPDVRYRMINIIVYPFSRNPVGINERLIDLVVEFTNNSLLYKNLNEGNENLLAIIAEFSKHQLTDLKPDVNDILSSKNPVEINKQLIQLVANVSTQQLTFDSLSDKLLEESNRNLTDFVVHFCEHLNIDIKPKIDGILESENPVEVNKKLLDLTLELFDTHLEQSNQKLKGLIVQFSKHQHIDNKPALDEIYASENPVEVNKKLLKLLVELSTQQLNYDSLSDTNLEESKQILTNLIVDFSKHQHIDQPRLDDIYASKNPVEVNKKLLELAVELSAHQLNYDLLSDTNLEESKQILTDLIVEFSKHQHIDNKPKLDEIYASKNPVEVNKKLLKLLVELSRYQLNYDSLSDTNLEESKQILTDLIVEFSKHQHIDQPRLDEIYASKNPVEVNKKLLKLAVELSRQQLNYDSLSDTNLEESKHILTNLIVELSKHQHIDNNSRLDGIYASKNPVETNKKLLKLLVELSTHQLTSDSLSDKFLEASNRNLIDFVVQFSEHHNIDIKPKIDGILASKNPVEVNKKLLDLMVELFDTHLEQSNQKLKGLIVQFSEHQHINNKPRLDEIYASENPVETNKKLLKLLVELSTHQLNYDSLSDTNLEESKHILTNLIVELSKHQHIDNNSRLDEIYASKNPVEVNKKLLELAVELSTHPSTYDSLSSTNLEESNRILTNLIVEFSKHQHTDNKPILDEILANKNPVELNKKLFELLKHLSDNVNPATGNSLYVKSLEENNDQLTELVTKLWKYQPTGFKSRIDDTLSIKDPVERNKRLIYLVAQLCNDQLTTHVTPTTNDLKETKEKLLKIVSEFSKNQFIEFSKVDNIISNNNPAEVNKKLFELVLEISKQKLANVKPTVDESHFLKNLLAANEHLTKLVKTLSKHQPTEIITRLYHILSYKDPSTINKELIDLLAELSSYPVTDVKPADDNSLSSITLNETNDELLNILRELSKHQSTDITPRVDYILSYKEPVEVNRKLVEFVSELCKNQLSITKPAVEDSYFLRNILEANIRLEHVVTVLSNHKSTNVKNRLNNILLLKDPVNINQKLINLVSELSKSELSTAKHTAAESFFRKNLVEINKKLLQIVVELSKRQSINIKPTISYILSSKNPVEINKKLLELVAKLSTHQVYHDSSSFYKKLADTNKDLIEVVTEFFKHQSTDFKPEADELLSNKNPIEVNRRLTELVSEYSKHQQTGVTSLSGDSFYHKNTNEINKNYIGLRTENQFSYKDAAQTNKEIVDSVLSGATYKLNDVKPAEDTLSLNKYFNDAHNNINGLLEGLPKHELADVKFTNHNSYKTSAEGNKNLNDFINHSTNNGLANYNTPGEHKTKVADQWNTGPQYGTRKGYANPLDKFSNVKH